MVAVGSVPIDALPGEISPQDMNGLINEELTELQGKIGGQILSNPDFRIAQLGEGPFSANGTTLDMWTLQNGSGATNAISRAAGLTDDSEYSLEWDRTVQGSTATVVENRIEDVRLFGNTTLTFSYDVRSLTGGNVPYSMDFAQIFGSGGSGGTNTGDIGFTATPTAQRFAAKITVPSVNGKIIGAGSYLRLRFIRGAGQANGAIRIGRVKLEPGDVATPFFWRPIELELALAQRQLTKSYELGTAPGSAATLVGAHVFRFSSAISTHIVNVQFPVRMRAVPSVTIYPTQTTGNAGNVSGGAGGNPDASLHVVNSIGSPSERGFNRLFLNTADDNSFFHWVAEAPL